MAALIILTTYSPRNWVPEQKVLGRNFPFWLMVVGLADQAFKGIQTVEELLDKRPPKGRESWSFEWDDCKKELPILQMVKTDGANNHHTLTFASLRHHFYSLAKRACFRDVLHIHGIRGAVANKLDGM